MIDTSKIYTTKNYGDLRVVNYRGAFSVDVEFIATGYRTTTRAGSIALGTVKDNTVPHVCGVGFIGDGKHKSRVDGVMSKCYITWRGMLSRCYDNRQLSYRDCTVCDEWHNFQNFSKWFDLNYVDGCHLDKDIKIKGNKVYSPLSCGFVTRGENNIEAQAKHYEFKSPSGYVVSIYNLSEFCRVNGLSQGNMSMVHSGIRGSHKGWVRS